MGRTRLAAALLAGAALMCANAGARAQSDKSRAAPPYPSHEIRFVIPFPPGGGNDSVGRVVADALQRSLGQPVLVDYRGGAGGIPGTEIAARATPDGYTLLLNNISLAVNATLFPKLPYDTQKDLQPVAIIGHQPSFLVIYPGLQVKSVGELLELARKQPGQMIYGSGGQGSSSHLAAERLELATKVRMTHVPYKGLAPAIADLSAGKVEMVIATSSTVLPALKANKVRALAVTTRTRSSQFPQLPTMIEAGVADFDVSTWYALLVPARTPRAVVAKLNGELEKGANSAAVKEQYSAQGLVPGHTTPEAARTFIAAEIAKWGAVIKAAGIKPN